LEKRPGIWQQEEATLKYYRKCGIRLKNCKKNPEELKKQVYLSKDHLGQMAWHIAKEAVRVEILEKLWNWAKELQLKPEDISKQLYFSKDECVDKRPGN
jgi:hypothetical protein